MSDITLIVAGSRSLENRVGGFLEEGGRRVVARAIVGACPFSRTDVSTVVSGTASGPDKWGEAWASKIDFVDLKRMPADWETHGKAAGPKRNREMAKVADSLLAFYDGSSAGTRNMIGTARELGLDVTVVDMSDEGQRRAVLGAL